MTATAVAPQTSSAVRSRKAGTAGSAEFLVTSPAPHGAWEACYRNDPTAVVSQSPAWARAMEQTRGWRDASRLYRFADGRELVLPLVARRRAGGISLASMPDAWGYGGLLGADVDTESVACVMQDLADLRTGWVRVRPNPLHADAYARAAAATGALAIPKRAHVLDLDRPAEEIFRACFASSARRAVRSAEKAGIEVERDVDGNLVPVFHDLLMRSVERWAGSSHEPLALARWRAERRDPLPKFLAWREALGDAFRLTVARRAGVPIAAMVVLQGHNAHMTRSAMDRELVGNDRPNELLMWHAIRDAAEAGCRSFHLGESGRSTSLSRYKEKYGARPHDYAEVRIEHVPVTRLDGLARGAVKRAIGFREP